MSFDYQPVLKGEVVELRPLRSEDYDDLYSIAADPLMWEQHPERDRHEEAVFQEFFSRAVASGGALVAIDARTRQVIGSSRLLPRRREPPLAAGCGENRRASSGVEA